MLTLLLISLNACAGRISNLPSFPTATVSATSDVLSEVPSREVFTVASQEELMNTVNVINESKDATREFVIQIAPGDYYLGSQPVEVKSKHLDDEKIYTINSGLSMNCNSKLEIHAVDPSNKPRIIFDAVINDVGIHIGGNCSVDITDIEVHSIPASLTSPLDNVEQVYPIRSSIYIEGNEISGRNINLGGVSLFDNVDRSQIIDGNDIEYSGIVIKHAQRAELDNIRMERFYGDGVSFFNVYNAFVRQSTFLRDGERMRSGTAIGSITLGASYLEGDKLTIDGYYKGMNIYPANGASVNGSSLVLKNSTVNNIGGEMYYIVNATNAITTLSNVQHTSPQGVVFPILQSNYADVITSSFILANSNSTRSYFDIDGVPYVVRANKISVLNSSIRNTVSLPLQAIDMLKAQGFRLE